MAIHNNLKLSPCYYGPCKIVKKNRHVTYKLNLPNGSKIYPVFHVSNLKRKLGSDVAIEFPHDSKDG